MYSAICISMISNCNILHINHSKTAITSFNSEINCKIF